MQCKWVQLMGQRKHQMIISAGQQICFPFLYPFFPLMSLALWAMTVAATIIADADVAAAALLQLVEIILYLFRIQICRQALKM